MSDFFKVLDHEGTGYLTPEAFSSFLEANGFSATEDPWRLNQKPLSGPWLPVDNADFELKAAYEAWFFPHRVVSRSSVRPLLPHGGMPLLALPGFIDYLAIECSAEGPARVRGLNAALTRYGSGMDPRWLAMGEIPGWALPREVPGKVRRRIDDANARSVRTARERIEASRVQHEIMAQGRRNAEELVSDVRYVWRPY